MKNNKYIVLIGLCIFTLAVGILGIANVGFFNSNTGIGDHRDSYRYWRPAHCAAQIKLTAHVILIPQ